MDHVRYLPSRAHVIMPDIRHSIGGIYGVPGFTPLQRFFLA